MMNFISKIIVSTLILFLVGIFPFLYWGQNYLIELMSSFLVSLINVLVGYYLALVSIDKSTAEFYKYVYGGMLIRMMVVLGCSIYMIKISFVAMIPYMLLLLLFYIIHQWIEISGWLKELPNRKVQLNL